MQLGADILIDRDPENKKIKVTVKGKEGTCDFMDLWAAVFAMSGPEEQEKMMPVRQTEVTHYDRQHRIRLLKDMKKGEIVTANCHISVPTSVVEGLKGMVEKETKARIGLPIIGK